jgi:hypothetical protein
MLYKCYIKCAFFLKYIKYYEIYMCAHVCLMNVLFGCMQKKNNHNKSAINELLTNIIEFII